LGNYGRVIRRGENGELFNGMTGGGENCYIKIKKGRAGEGIQSEKDEKLFQMHDE
jgi:hypothetical protein